MQRSNVELHELKSPCLPEPVPYALVTQPGYHQSSPLPLCLVLMGGGIGRAHARDLRCFPQVPAHLPASGSWQRGSTRECRALPRLFRHRAGNSSPSSAHSCARCVTVPQLPIRPRILDTACCPRLTRSGWASKAAIGDRWTCSPAPSASFAVKFLAKLAGGCLC